VTAGPNLRGPTFQQYLYEASVLESAAKFAKVITVEAKDPGELNFSSSRPLSNYSLSPC
jgi:hypothetical protein